MATYKGCIYLAIAFLLLTKAQIRGYDLDDDDDDDDDDENMPDKPATAKVNDLNSFAIGDTAALQDKNLEAAEPLKQANEGIKKEKEAKKVKQEVENRKVEEKIPEKEMKSPKEETKSPKEETKSPKEETKSPKEEVKSPKEEIKNSNEPSPGNKGTKASAQPGKVEENSDSKDEVSAAGGSEKLDLQNLLSSPVFLSAPPDPVFHFKYKSYVLSTVDEAYSSDPQNIPMVLQFAEKGDLDHSLLTYKALVQSMRNKKGGDEDIFQKIAFVKAIDARLILNPQSELYHRSEGLILKKKLLKVIKNLQVESLKRLIKDTKSMNEPGINKHIAEVTKYSRSLSERIMKQIVGDLFNTFDRSILLDAIANQHFTTPSIQALKVFFDLLEDSKDNDKFYLPFARYLQGKESSPFFISISKDTRDLYEYMKSSLPYSVKNIAYSPGRLCFRNAESSDYLYAANVSGVHLNPHDYSLFASKHLSVEGVWGIEKNGEHYNIVNLFFNRYLSANSSRKSETLYKNPKYDVLVHMFNIEDAELYDFEVQDDFVLLKNVGKNEYLTLSDIFLSNIKRVAADKSVTAKEKVSWVAEDCSHIVYPFKSMKLSKQDYDQASSF